MDPLIIATTPNPATNGSAPIHHFPKHRYIWGVVITVVLIQIIIATVVTLGLIIPQRQTTAFIQASQLILKNYDEEMDQLYQQNFLAARNVTKDMSEAEDVLSKHIGDLEENKLTLAVLKIDYQSLKQTPKVADIDQDFQQMFDLSDQILEKYSDTLQLRRQIMLAYGSKLPAELLSYTGQYYRGGDRPTYILQTQKIIELAEDSIIKMNNLQVKTDDQPGFATKLEFLVEVKATFTRLNELYRLFQDNKVSDEITNLTIKTDELNQKYDGQVGTYLRDSSIAKDFESYQQKAKQLKEGLSEESSR